MVFPVMYLHVMITFSLLEALVRVCNEIDQSGAGGTPDDYAFIKAILQDVVVDAMFQVGQLIFFQLIYYCCFVHMSYVIHLHRKTVCHHLFCFSIGQAVSWMGKRCILDDAMALIAAFWSDKLCMCVTSMVVLDHVHVVTTSVT